MKLTPRSSASSMTRRVPSGSILRLNIIPPRHRRLTSIPVFPNRTYCMSATIIAHVRRVRIDFRSEKAKRDQRLDVGCVFECHAGAGGRYGAENLVFAQFTEANHRRRRQPQRVNPSLPLHADQTI